MLFVGNLGRSWEEGLFLTVSASAADAAAWGC